jgi:hypothetical protein
MGLLLKIAARFDPREARSAVTISSSMLTPDEGVIRVQIYNLSSKGFMAEIADGLTPGTWVGLELPSHGIVRARIRWSAGEAIGGQFAKPIDLDRLRASSRNEAHGLFQTRIVQFPL